MEHLSQTKFVTEIIKVLSLLLIGVLTSACYRTTDAIHHVFYSENDDVAGSQVWCRFESPIVVAGVISNVEYIEQPMAKGAYGTALYLVHMDIDVDEVLKGTLPRQRLRIIGFVMRAPGPKQRDGGLQATDYKTGQRRIFFVREEGDTFRLARDNYDYSIRYDTGIHDNARRGDVVPRERAAYLLLVPERGADIQAWTSRLFSNLGVSTLLVGPVAVDKIITENEYNISMQAKNVQWREEMQNYRNSIPALTGLLEDQNRRYPCLDFGQESAQTRTKPSRE